MHPKTGCMGICSIYSFLKTTNTLIIGLLTHMTL